MRKRFGLAVVGFAIAFGVASRIDSHARENQPLSVPSTSAKQQILANPNPLKVTAFPTEGVFLNPSINPNRALHFDLTAVKTQTSDSAILESPSNLHNKTLSTGNLYAQTSTEDIPKTKDGERFRRIMQEAMVQQYHQRPMGEILQVIANEFLGAAYKGNLLDQSQEETLVINLHEFDCVLFVETVLAIARGVAVQDYSYSTFVTHLRNQRYWDGQIDGYCSRLHYFSQWIYDNQKRGTVQNLGLKLGGVALNKTLNFMSTHRQSYAQMAKDDANYQCIAKREAQLDGVTLDYIPTKQIRHTYSQLQPGDIIAVATKIPGLDVTHTGFVYRQANGNFGFIHASPAGQVTIARDLQTYVSRVENAIGILVVRPLDRRQTQNSYNF